MSDSMRLTIDRSGCCPRLLLDGQPVTVQGYLRSWEKYPGREGTTFVELCADYRRHYALGCRVFIFQATCASDFYVPDVEVWRGPDEWDFRGQPQSRTYEIRIWGRQPLQATIDGVSARTDTAEYVSFRTAALPLAQEHSICVNGR